MNNYFKIYIVYLGERRHEDPELVTESHHDMLASVLGRYVVVRMYHVLHVPRTTHMLAMLLCPAFFIYNTHIQNLHARKYTSLKSAAALINHFFWVFKQGGRSEFDCVQLQTRFLWLCCKDD